MYYELSQPYKLEKDCPKELTKKKNAIAAEDVFDLPMLSRMDIIIMQIESAAQPQIMVQRRPILSRAKAGTVLPIGNMS